MNLDDLFGRMREILADKQRGLGRRGEAEGGERDGSQRVVEETTHSSITC